MNEIKFRSDMGVELIQWMGSDSMVVHSARISTGGSSSEELTDKDKGLINYLMRDRHGTPFEHATFTFRVEAPIFVFREFMRHRIASYNEESGRYKELSPVFYVADDERKLIQVGKPGAYTFEQGTEAQTSLMQQQTKHACKTAYASYESMLANGVAREVARGVLPVSTYSSMYVTMNARSLMNFLSLRSSEQGTYPSFPQAEIAMVAEKMEKLFAEKMPVTYATFSKNGRVAP